jgi:hypothetical protein
VTDRPGIEQTDVLLIQSAHRLNEIRATLRRGRQLLETSRALLGTRHRENSIKQPMFKPDKGAYAVARVVLTKATRAE